MQKKNRETDAAKFDISFKYQVIIRNVDVGSINSGDKQIWSTLTHVFKRENI